MNPDFSRSLSLLRQERGLSQRQVAKELGISQALLSHYENGIREPGLNFVVKACDFYNVSADFLLGRTLSRDGTTILDADTLYDASTERDNVLKGSVLATLSKKLLVNSIGVLFDLLGKLGNKRAIKAAANYLSTSVYQLYRHLCRSSPSRTLWAVPAWAHISAQVQVARICSFGHSIQMATPRPTLTAIWASNFRGSHSLTAASPPFLPHPLRQDAPPAASRQGKPVTPAEHIAPAPQQTAGRHRSGRA